MDSDKVQNGVAAWLEALCTRHEEEKAAFAEKMRLKEEREASRKRKCGIAKEGDALVGTTYTMITRAAARRAECRVEFADHCDRRGQETAQQGNSERDADKIEMQAEALTLSECTKNNDENKPADEQQHLLGLSSPALCPRAASCPPNSPRLRTKLALVPEQSSALPLSTEPPVWNGHRQFPNLSVGAAAPPTESSEAPPGHDCLPLRLYELPLLLRLSDPPSLTVESVPLGEGEPGKRHPTCDDHIRPHALNNIVGTGQFKFMQAPFLCRARDVQPARRIPSLPRQLKLSDLPLAQPLRLSELGPLFSPALDDAPGPPSKRQKLGPISLLSRLTGMSNATDDTEVANVIQSKPKLARRRTRRGCRAGKPAKEKRARRRLEQQVRPGDEKIPMKVPSRYIRQTLAACGAL
ncbi:hypothetical protein C8R47DRAFT_1169869 [Mycena vitilis]|nr:hypothetical protein C8R47DRAFT_1169869 [Mycena vitilis]